MRKIISSFLSLMVGNVFSLATSFVLSLLLVQKLSLADYSLQSAVVAFAGIVFGFADLGLFDVGTRDLARQSADGQRRFYGGLLALQLVLSSTICLIAVIIARILNSFPGESFVIFLMGMFSLVLSYAPIIPTEALLSVRGRVRRMALLQSFYAGGVLLLGAIILLTGGGIGPLYIAFSVLSVVTIGLYLIAAAALLGGRVPLNRDKWGYYLRQGIPIGMSAAFYVSCLRLGTYLAFTDGYIADASYLGVSNLVIQAVTSIMWVPFIIVIFPHLARIEESRLDQLKWISSRTVTWLLAMTLPIAVGTTLLAPDVLAVLSQSQIPAAPTLRMIIWALPLAISVSFMYRLLLIRSKQKLYIVATAAGAAVNALLCLILIPRAGGIGAAIATVAGLGVITVITAWALRGILFDHIRYLDLLRMGAALAGMVGALALTPHWYVLLRIGLGAIVYGILLVFSRVVTLADLQTIWAMQSARSVQNDAAEAENGRPTA